ncbi:hypothetical protein Nepgr_000887 [Nepenthes gracilis]|uniref:DYW domain-containing protein n=1 Tax=Nepenthes gracilis TaxID=150966 RepID=A0AAD3P623_NEPGR|nr:hypothetical protein Nepgr_000887 [Nepenthes gracilis]
MSERLRLGKLLRKCSRNLLVDQGMQVHAAVVKTEACFDMIMSNDLIDMYGKCCRMDYACQVFDRMPERNVVSWTALMWGFLNQGNTEETLRLLNLTSYSDVKPNEYTFSTGLKACGLQGIPEIGMQVHSICVKTGYEWFPAVGNALVDMYAKCGRISEATLAFHRVPAKELITWNTIIAGYSSSEGSNDKSLLLFKKMQDQGEIPDQFTFTSLLKACSGAGAIHEGTQIHAALIVRGFPVLHQAVIVGALIDLYVKCGYLLEARKLFDHIEQKNVTSWTALVLGYAQEGSLLEAMELFRVLRDSSIQVVDGFLLSGLIGVFADFAFVEQGKQMHAYAIKVPSGLHLSVMNSVVDMYLKCGLVEEAEQFFNEMPTRNVVSYSTMITGYGKHGLGKEAILIFNEMLVENVRPDQVSYLAILSACSHSGLTDECQHYFLRLCNDRWIKPKLEHYACVVDLLGRAGRLKEAKNLIDNMPLKPDIGIWQTLLSSCKVHGYLEMGKEVGQILLSLDSDNPVNYVLMSNLYANAGCWKECEKIREVVKRKRLRKEAGQSWVEIDKEFHFFYGGDDAHPLTVKIHQLLKEMEKRLKVELGYDFNVQFTLHDVEDESKEENLRVHSERLAIGLALLCGGTEEDGKVIRIFKNLRVCGDCHEFIKGLSKVLRKVFLVRDASRFHKFEDGLCSCRNYW